MSEKENLINGLKEFTDQTAKLVNKFENHEMIDTNQLVTLYGNISVLIFRGICADLWKEVVYPAQELQADLGQINLLISYYQEDENVK
jgi:hypothetical protein